MKYHPSNWLHFLFGGVISICTFVMSYYEWDLTWFVSVLCGTGMALAAGVIKEFWDLPKFDWLELIFTVVGGFIGGLLISLITLVL